MNKYYFNDVEEGKQIAKLNGRSVMEALAFLNYDATESELSQLIISSTGQPAKPVRDEVKRILDYGVNRGFIIKVKNNYSLPDVYQTDCDKKWKAAQKFFNNCIIQLEELYPGFDYQNYMENRVTGAPLDDSDMESSKSTDNEMSDTDDESEADVTLCASPLTKEQARTLAESAKYVDPCVYSCGDTSCSEAEADSEEDITSPNKSSCTGNLTPKATKRSLSGENPCKTPQGTSKRKSPCGSSQCTPSKKSKPYE